MKTFLIIAGLLGATTGLFAQGTLVFANLAAGVNAPVTNLVSGTRVTSSNYVADLYFSTTTDATSSSLSPAGFNVAFSTLTGGGGGFFLGGVRTVTGASAAIEAQVRVWDITLFPTYNAALQGGGVTGVSGTLIVNLAIPPAPAPTMAGLTAFGVVVLIPEPSTFGLAGLGAAALLAFRRRK